MARLRLGGIHRHATGARGVPPLLSPLILLLPNVKSVHRLTDAWQRADCAYLLSKVERSAYSQNAFCRQPKGRPQTSYAGRTAMFDIRHSLNVRLRVMLAVYFS